MSDLEREADICLVLEGTYPYIVGGVSKWTHDLICSEKDLTFHIVTIVPPRMNLVRKFEVPSNVLSITNVVLQELPEGDKGMSNKEAMEFFAKIELPLLNLQHNPTLEELKYMIDILTNTKKVLGSALLLNSEEAWRMSVRMYLTTLGESSFINFFWSCRTLLSSFYSLMLAPLPKASVYHTICTGFAGVFTARAKVETGKPCILTEHGIYTNERRIEISSAQWLEDLKSPDWTVEISKFERDLKDYWMDTFTGYAKLCYDAVSLIITLYEGNQEFQIEDGASRDKLAIIPNGIDFDKYSKIVRKEGYPPTFAFIGRVSPIKDVKTFIEASLIVHQQIPNVRVLLLGPTDEYPEYFEECMEAIRILKLEDVIELKGNVNISDYLGEIDVMVLTSISEAQPLVILEAGAVGIPTVATDVGACREMLYGRDDSEDIGQGGIVCPLANPSAIAEAIIRFFRDPVFYDNCSRVIKERVRRYYQIVDQQRSYKKLYRDLIEESRILVKR